MVYNPFSSEESDPLDIFCNHFNVGRATVPAGPLPTTLDLPIVRHGALAPSHLLAAYQIDADPKHEPLLLPIDAALYARSFRTGVDIPGFDLPAPPLEHVCATTKPTGAGFPSPPPTPPSRLRPPAANITVTLPVFPIIVPDVASLPLLLLFALSFETHIDSLAFRLLPRTAVSEFPNAAAMAVALARARFDRGAFENLVQRNFGMWGNVLALGLQNGRVERVVRLCWNVTAEAKKLRNTRGASPVPF